MVELLSTVTKYFDPDEQKDIPGVVVQVIKGVGVYIVWAGVTATRPASSEEQDLDLIVQEGRLGADWACSMPPVKSLDSMESNATEAQRFGKQIFVSIDISPAFSVGGNGPMLALAIEKAIVTALKSIEETPE
ncbi:hypothetical protein FRC17_006284 [Serendipita sp. 399]|nr:hypothetical protein FRC17_006284 [Serendipita sp. 399]